MLTLAYAISFLGMIVLPIGLWIYFTRKFALSWKLLLAGGLTFIASQILHIPLVLALRPVLGNVSLLINAILLGLLAGVFEETARYILFKFILKRSRSWKEGILVGLGHGGTEAMILGVMAVLTLVNMMLYRTVDLSTVPSIPADQLEAAKQQVAAYWSVPMYMPFVGLLERTFAICLHVSLSAMVLYSIAANKPVWFWLALLWHAIVDAAAVYIGQQIGALPAEATTGIAALISLWIIFMLRRKFSQDLPSLTEGQVTNSPSLSHV
jgi:uncharacterized membrane protein YhfC